MSVQTLSNATNEKEGPGRTPDKADATPMMAQYLAIKDSYPDCLLFYRMGDFYELFFDDAKKAAKTLDIALTSRGRHGGDGIPMAGVPVQSADAYLARLIKAGHKVAVCEQTETPEEAKKRGPKALVNRDVIRLVTPGTLTEDTLLDSRRNNYIAAIAKAEGNLALAWADMSTGTLCSMPTDGSCLAADIAQLGPGEILASEGLMHDPLSADGLADINDILTVLDGKPRDSVWAERRLSALFRVKSLDSFGNFSRAELAAFGALLSYMEETQKGKLPRLSPPERLSRGAIMQIDASTRRNLEIVRTLGGEKKGSLLATIDKTVTGPGARMLAQNITAPSTDLTLVKSRHDAVAFFVENGHLREEIRQYLRRVADLERAAMRLSLHRGSPRDLASIRDSLNLAAQIKIRLAAGDNPPALPKALGAARTGLGGHEALIGELSKALVAEPPNLAREGGFIAKNYHAGLDELRMMRDESRRLITALEAKYRESTDIPTLKIKHNNVLGYHIDVSAKAAEKLINPPYSEMFTHRQTLASSVRFSTTELGELAMKISQSADRALALEQDLFAELVAKVNDAWAGISKTAQALALFDVAAGLADLAVSARWVRPQMTDGLDFFIKGGRHPVVEAALLKADSGPFIANDCDLGQTQRLWLITGPNMAGKSTFLRQNALIAILAQAGAFVPADEATIGLVDRLFSRVGASDDLAHGRSTFMVEMVETAAILNQASERSLVILDEIGRGTATFDGLSIAWATVENLHDVNRARALFATHYHELAALKEKLDSLALYSMRVKEWQGDVVFLHEVKQGAADRSYGIQVAKLAGLPGQVIARAKQVLDELETGGGSHERTKAIVNDLPLFQTSAGSDEAADEDGPLKRLFEQVEAIHPDTLTPREALDTLYRLKDLTEGKR